MRIMQEIQQGNNQAVRDEASWGGIKMGKLWHKDYELNKEIEKSKIQNPKFKWNPNLQKLKNEYTI